MPKIHILKLQTFCRSEWSQLSKNHENPPFLRIYCVIICLPRNDLKSSGCRYVRALFRSEDQMLISVSFWHLTFTRYFQNFSVFSQQATERSDVKEFRTHFPIPLNWELCDLFLFYFFEPSLFVSQSCSHSFSDFEWDRVVCLD